MEFQRSKFGANKLANLLLKYNYQVKKGDILAGTLVGIERRQILIDIGLQRVAFLPKSQITIHADLILNICGEFLILDFEKDNKKIILSRNRLQYLKLWERFKQLNLKNMIFFSSLEKNIRGGALSWFDTLKVFIPKYHLPKYYRRKTGSKKIIPIKILEVKAQKFQIVGSSKLAFFKRQSPSLRQGMVTLGTVLTIKPFGLLLNIQGIKSLLHISEIANKRIENINTLFKKGDRIQVKIIYINRSFGKIALSARALLG